MVSVYPTFVAIGTVTVRLVKVNNKMATYYRHAGAWDVLVKRTEDGKLICAHNTGPLAHSNGVEAKECSQQEWEEDNAGYIPIGVLE